jgi:DNA-binding transcriptional regulator YhcF (GntR family)
MKIMIIIENDIISGVYQDDALIISTPQIAKGYGVNPATAVKAVSKLADAGILYKKRGIGMCVAAGAREKVIQQRREALLNNTVTGLMEEAERLEISPEQIVSVIMSSKSKTDNKK